MHPFFITVIGAVFILLLVLIKLVIYRQGKIYLNVLLTLAILGVIWYAIIFLLTNSGHIIRYPYLFNKGLPLYYLATPCLYLYLRGSLFKQHSRFKAQHLFHFLIAVPAVINLIPYNMLSASEQHAVVAHVVRDVKYALNGDEYIVDSWHWFALPVSALIYIGLLIQIIRKAAVDQIKPKSLFRWLYLFCGVWGGIFSTMLLVNISILINFDQAWYILNQSYLILWSCCLLLFLSILFFLNAEFFYGLVRTNHLVSSSENNHQPILPLQIRNPEEQFVSTDGIEEVLSVTKKEINQELITLVESHLIAAKLFRQTGLTLSILSALIEVPTHKLSELFNQHYGVNFNVYVNKLRIDYVLQRLDNGDWKQLTLEAIGTDAGFSSRNTFFIAFKKVTGLNPSTYLLLLKHRD